MDLSATLARDVAARPWRSTLAAAVISLVGTTIAVAVADVLLAGFRVQYPGGAVAFAVVATAVTMLAQPLMVGGSVRLGWWGVLLVAVLGQAAVVGVTARGCPLTMNANRGNTGDNARCHLCFASRVCR